MTDLTAPLPPPPRRADSAATDTEALFTTGQVADALHVTEGAVRAMHTRGTGPPSVKKGRRRLYPAEAFDAWLREVGT
jgi:hypothetical protein